jgi:hypothetical protein
MARDVIGRYHETLPGTPLLRQVMRRGARVSPAKPLAEIQARCREEIAKLPAELRGLAPATHPFAVEVSPALDEFERSVAREVAGG